jgi:hypothetical protein
LLLSKGDLHTLGRHNTWSKRRMEEGVCFQQLGIQLVSSKVYTAELNSQMIHKQYPLKFISTFQSYLPDRNLKPSINLQNGLT